MIKGNIALLLLVYSAALAAEPGVSDTSCVAAVKQMCDRQVIGQAENGDWAFIGRYRNANAQLIGARIRPNVVFMGDSITEFWAKQPDFKRDSARVGRGISAQSSPQILLRFRADVINLKPRVVHIMAGTNDIAEATGRESDDEIEGYISNMVELAQVHGIKVVLASIPPAADFPWHTGLNPAPRIRALNNWLKTYAMEQKLTYVDYWSVLSAPDGGMKRDFSDDGVHPNVNGYLAMEPLAEAAITKALQ
jgi:lysophospholipase L1-like esterase